MQKSTTPATLASHFGMIQIITPKACALLDMQGTARGTGGNVHRSQSLATLWRNEVVRPWPAERRARKCHECADQSRLE